MATPGAPAETTPATQTAPAVALSPYDELVKTSRAQFEAKDFAGAQKTVEQMLAIAQTPKEKSDAMLRLGKTLDAQNRYAQAREVWQKMLPLVQDSPDDLSLARLVIASSYANQEMWQPAADGFAEVLKDPLVKDKSVIRLALATAYISLKQTDKAREQLALVAADETMEADMRGFAQFSIGKIYLDEGKFDEARQNVEAAAKIPGVSGEILIGVYDTLALIAGKQNRPDDAKQAFTNERSLLMQKADGQYKAKDFDGAIASYKAALGAGVPEAIIELTAHQQIGSALQAQEKYDEARAEYQFVLDTELDPSDKSQMQMLPLIKPGAYIGIANGYIAQKQFDKARETVTRMLEMPNLLAPFRLSAEALLKQLPPK